MKTAEAQITTNIENKQLKETIESLRKEVNDLNSHKDDDDIEICLLKDKIKYLKEENVDNEKKLQTVNQNLLARIKSILKCDECDQSFKDKASTKAHLLLEHSELKFKCDHCDTKFNTKADLTCHVNKDHRKEIIKDSLLKRYNELVSSVKNQEMKFLNNLYKLKVEETKQEEKCYCKGNYCAINHARFRWTFSKADRIYSKFTSVITDDTEKVSQGESEKGDSNNENNEISSTFPCDHCDQTFHDDKAFIEHREREHVQSLLECTFVNPSLLNSN